MFPNSFLYKPRRKQFIIIWRMTRLYSTSPACIHQQYASFHQAYVETDSFVEQIKEMFPMNFKGNDELI